MYPCKVAAGRFEEGLKRQLSSSFFHVIIADHQLMSGERVKVAVLKIKSIIELKYWLLCAGGHTAA